VTVVVESGVAGGTERRMSTTKDPDKTAIERAVELAESGEVRTIADVQQRLKQEGYENVDSILGPWVLRELRRMIDEKARRRSWLGTSPSRPLALNAGPRCQWSLRRIVGPAQHST
jgi:hypothetical protein